MTRTLPLIAALATGCIIYEDRDRAEPCDDCPIGTATPGPEQDPVADPEPEPEGPKLTSALALTVNEAVPGATLLSTLVPLDPEIQFDTIQSIGFERDVVVVDSMSRPFEMVLLLSVAPEAELGDIEVYAEAEQGTGSILEEPFHIVESTTGSAGTPGTTTGCP